MSQSLSAHEKLSATRTYGILSRALPRHAAIGMCSGVQVSAASDAPPSIRFVSFRDESDKAAEDALNLRLGIAGKNPPNLYPRVGESPAELKSAEARLKGA